MKAICSESKHGKDRVRERTGINKKGVHRAAEKAMEKGLKHSEVSGSLSRYLCSLYLSHRSGANMRIYNNEVFIFDVKKNLITVIDLPTKYHKVVKQIKDKKDNRELGN